MRWVVHVARTGEMRNAYILLGKPDWKILLRRCGHLSEDNIKTVLKEIRCDDVDYSSYSGWGPAFVSTAVNFRVL